MKSNTTLDLAKLFISPENNLKEIDAFDDAAHAIACGYINQTNELAAAMNAEKARADAAEARCDELEKELEQANPVYCPSCGHCGEEGCCGPLTKCKDAKPRHCLYGNTALEQDGGE